MDNEFNHQIESIENNAKWFFLDGFRWAKINPKMEMPDAERFIDDIILTQRKNRNLMSVVPESK